MIEYHVYAPFRALADRNTNSLGVSLVEKEGVYYQRLRLGDDIGYKLLHPDQEVLLNKSFEAENVHVIIARPGEEVLLPEDTINMAHVDLNHLAASGQGETFGEKINRLVAKVGSELEIPANAFAFSTSGQLVVVLPYK